MKRWVCHLTTEAVSAQSTRQGDCLFLLRCLMAASAPFLVGAVVFELADCGGLERSQKFQKASPKRCSTNEVETKFRKSTLHAYAPKAIHEPTPPVKARARRNATMLEHSVHQAAHERTDDETQLLHQRGSTCRKGQATTESSNKKPPGSLQRKPSVGGARRAGTSQHQ